MSKRIRSNRACVFRKSYQSHQLVFHQHESLIPTLDELRTNEESQACVSYKVECSIVSLLCVATEQKVRVLRVSR